MDFDKRILTKEIIDTKASEIVVLNTSAADKDAVKTTQKEMAKFMRKEGDYLVIAIRK